MGWQRLSRGKKRMKDLQKDPVVTDASITQTSDRVRRLLAHATSRAAIPYLLSAAFLVFAVVLMGHEVVKNISAIEAWITGLGPWGIVAYVIFFLVTTSFLLPDSILCIAAGALFGLWWGTTAVLFGILISGALQFYLARRLLHSPIQRVIAKRPALAAIQHAVIQDELRLQFLVRLTPINPAIVNYVLGATHVRFFGFLLACLGHMPAIVVEVYFGHASKNMVQLADGRPLYAIMENLVLFGGLAVCVAVLVIVSRMARKALLQAIAESESEPAPD